MNRFIELYGEEEDEGTSSVPSVSIEEEKEKLFDLEKYPRMIMKAKTTYYKIVFE